MYDEYLDFAKQLAYKAGDIMHKHLDSNSETEYKDDNTIVTVADREINSMVIARVKATYSGHGIDGEEESSERSARFLWVCDPIDGTNPFAMGLRVSVFSLALVIDGAPVIGVIYDPFGDKLYYAQLGKGAWVNNKKITVSQEGFNNKQRMNFDWWPESDYDILTPLKKLSVDRKIYLLSPGSTTHMAALVARGEFIASIFPGTKGKNVDIAAAKIIVEEAGGKVTDLFGDEQRYDRDIKGAIVSNGIVHDEIVKQLRNSLEGTV